jgi:hypothetical protein
MKEYTLAQEIFDRVSIHLILQSKKSTNEVGCAYRGDGGTMCAVGCLIKDEHYSKVLEGRTIGNEHVICALRKSLPSQAIHEYFNLILRLQEIHDECISEDWSVRLKQLARDFQLSAEAVEFAQDVSLKGYLK